MKWSTYNQVSGWYASNNADMFAGVAPSNWGDNKAKASAMSSDKEMLRTLFTRKGYAGKNVTVVADEWYYYSSTNSKHAAVLFRIRNTTASPINWHLYFYATSSNSYAEVASLSLNGEDTWYTTDDNNASKTWNQSLSIPANRTSTVILIASSTNVSTTRGLYLAFYNDSLELPDGLVYVDDLDIATGGWEQ